MVYASRHIKLIVRNSNTSITLSEDLQSSVKMRLLLRIQPHHLKRLSGCIYPFVRDSVKAAIMAFASISRSFINKILFTVFVLNNNNKERCYIICSTVWKKDQHIASISSSWCVLLYLSDFQFWSTLFSTFIMLASINFNMVHYSLIRQAHF